MDIALIHVLLIDDDEDDFVNLKAVLNEISDSRYQLTWKNSYRDGLKELQSSTYDLCLLDFRLGELSGLDLLREAKRVGISTPIIFLTGHGDFELDIKAMQTGASDYLVKGQINAPLLDRAIRYSMKHALDLNELIEQKENFSLLFNSTFEGIVVHKDGLIVDANAAMGLIFGIEPPEAINTSLFDYFRSDFLEDLKTQLASQDEIQDEVVGIRGDGSEVSLSIWTKTIVLKGKPVGLMAVRDLTLQKELEAQILQQDRMAALGLLASSLAHEIGTPLGVIRGRAEMAAKTEDAKLRGTMELITSQIDRISKLVNSLLHIARGSNSGHAVDVDLAGVIKDVLSLMSHELNRRGIDIEVDVPEGLMVRAESGPMGQVFLNLLVNSTHAIEEVQKTGSKRAHFVRIMASEAADVVCVKFSDSGTGISEKNLKEIFKPFFTTKEVGVGTGLGLATSYKLVQSWGGSVTVESKLGDGATFTLNLLKGF